MNEINPQPLITDWITAIAASISAIILGLYTYYTWRMQKAVEDQAKELVHQRRLGLMPFLTVQMFSNHVEITNLGNGTALRIKVKPLEKIYKPIIESKDILEQLDELPILKSGETKRIESSQDLITQNLAAGLSGGLFIGIINYQDIEGNRYQQDLRNSSKDRVKFSFPKLIE